MRRCKGGSDKGGRGGSDKGNNSNHNGQNGTGPGNGMAIGLIPAAVVGTPTGPARESAITARTTGTVVIPMVAAKAARAENKSHDRLSG